MKSIRYENIRACIVAATVMCSLHSSESRSKYACKAINPPQASTSLIAICYKERQKQDEIVYRETLQALRTTRELSQDEIEAFEKHCTTTSTSHSKQIRTNWPIPEQVFLNALRKRASIGDETAMLHAKLRGVCRVQEHLPLPLRTKVLVEIIGKFLGTFVRISYQPNPSMPTVLLAVRAYVFFSDPRWRVQGAVLIKKIDIFDALGISTNNICLHIDNSGEQEQRRSLVSKPSLIFSFLQNNGIATATFYKQQADSSAICN